MLLTFVEIIVVQVVIVTNSVFISLLDDTVGHFNILCSFF